MLPNALLSNAAERLRPNAAESLVSNAAECPAFEC